MTVPEPGHVLIAGVTTRALAVSAARAGYQVTAVDAFGDRDLREVAEVIRVRAEPGRNHGPMQAAETAASVPAELAAYTSNFENYPAAVARLGEGRRLLGNSAEVLVRIRNPIEVMRVLRHHDLPWIETRSRPPQGQSHRSRWLLKPRRSGGGHGIVSWSPEKVVRRTMYLQRQVGGVPGSISFASDGASAVVLGVSRQLVGAADFGAGKFRYCGSIVGSEATPLFTRQADLLRYATEMVNLLTREFGLVGLNGLDFIARRGVPYPTEVNPRYSASMELIERSAGVSLFDIHVRACAGSLPTPLQHDGLVHGKAILFARSAVQIGKLPGWSGKQWIGDTPHAGERISQGRPICTVFAAARSREHCRRRLGDRAGAVYRALGAGVVRAA
jgi:predicted ATP-grasp superfamily ATP-dependent carboligase